MKKLIFFALTLLSSFSIFANNYPTPGDIIRNYFSTLDGGNTTELKKFLADNFLAVTPLAPSGADQQVWVATMQGFKAAFPDMKHEITSVVENGFWVAVSGAFTGKNDGPMMGAPATGNRVFAPFNAIFELDKSWKIKSINSQFDLKGFEAQLMAGLPNPDAITELNMRTMLAATDAGDIEKFESYWAPEGKSYFAGKETNMEETKKRIAAFKTGFPDIKRTLDKVVVSGNTVSIRGWVTGTNTGMFRGQPGTGNVIKVQWLGFYELNQQGKIKAGYVEFDTATLENQLKGTVASK